MNSKRLFGFLVFVILIAGLAGTAEPVRAQTAGPSFDVSFNPSGSQTIGNSVNIHIKVNSPNPGATRMNVSCGGVSKGETSEVEFDSTWNTNGCSAGSQQITIEARSPDDPNWSAANTQRFNYSLTGGQPPAEPTPEQPQGPSKGPNISTLELSPSGGANVGDQVDIHIRVDSGNPGATKINVSCGSISKVETSEIDFHSTWYTKGCPGGQARVDVYSRAVDDPNWTNPSSASKGYNLTAPPSYNAPTANFWADTESIQLGQCTYLHWNTSDADSVEIDGNRVGTSGDKQICPTVTTRYTLTAKGPGGTAERNVTVVVKNQPKQNSVASSFNTGDVINIGGNIYVIVNGERRLVPNPETLDALGITRSMINNRGFSDAQLNTIPQGPDIPDVNRDPSDFQEFKNWILPNLNPIVPESTPAPEKESTPTKAEGAKQNTSTLYPTPITDQAPTKSNDPFWCDWAVIGNLLCPSVKAAEVCHPQCMDEARSRRSDMDLWIPGTGTTSSEQVLSKAQTNPQFPWNGQTAQVSVRSHGDPPQAGDLIIWPSGCGDVPSNGLGHIGIVMIYQGNQVFVHDANWDNKCTVSERSVAIQSCMKFITSPVTVQTQSAPDNNQCSRYAWWDPRRWWCELTH